MLGLLLLLPSVAGVLWGFQDDPWPAYPGVANNNPGFTFLYPTAGSYYDVQLQTITKGVADKQNGGPQSISTQDVTGYWPSTMDNSTWAWTAAWKTTYKYSHGYAAGNVNYLMLMRTDPTAADGTTHAVGFGEIMSMNYMTCKYMAIDPPNLSRFPKDSCAWDFSQSVRYTINNKTYFEPGDGYFVAVINMENHTFVSVSDQFALNNTATPDPTRWDWLDAPKAGKNSAMGLSASVGVTVAAALALGLAL